MSGESTISVLCDCGKKLKAPATAAGRKARCPACGITVLLTAPVSSVATVGAGAVQPTRSRASKPFENDDELNSLSDLSDYEERSAPAAEAARCPSCLTEWNTGAVLCTDCGYDTRTGKVLSTANAATPITSVKAKKAKPVDLMAPQGSLIMGLIMSAVFSLVASVVWIVIAWFTGYSIGYVAILIGGAAGAGMQFGQKGHSTAGGRLAAVMSVFAILFAKVIVVELYLMRQGFNRSIFDLNPAKLGYYLFSPLSLLFMAIGMGAAYRAGNGSVS